MTVSRWTRLRMILTVAVLVGAFSLVLFRTYGLQTAQGARLRKLAERQHTKQVTLPPRRGSIFDRHRTPLAISIDVDSVYANPRQIKPEERLYVASQLADALGLDRWAVAQRLNSERYFVWIKRHITPKQSMRLDQLKLSGVAMVKESNRFYPNGGLASNVVGFVGLDARGLGGLEYAYEDLLRGRGRRVVRLRDALGRPVLASGRMDRPTAGHDIFVSIDRAIQHQAEQAAATAYSQVDPERGWVSIVVIDPQSGDILAMANAPSFDANNFGRSQPGERRNRAVNDAFEPGSAIKVVTLASALEHSAVHAGEIFDTGRGSFKIGRHVIHDSRPYSKLSVEDCLIKSSNICISQIAARLGRRRLFKALQQFGFGTKTGVRLPGERRGTLRDYRSWSDVGLANISFGQGMTATVLQLARAMSAIANDGILMRPRLVTAIRATDGKTMASFEPTGHRIIAASTANKLRKMLNEVTSERGTAPLAALAHYSTAGKTGTAQKADPTTGKYAEDRWVASFVGFAPATNPQIVVAVVVNEPAGKSYYGGDVAGPIFAQVARHALRYRGVEPDRVFASKPTTHRAPRKAPSPCSPVRLRHCPAAPRSSSPISLG